VQGLEGQQRDAISKIENLMWFRNKNADRGTNHNTVHVAPTFSADSSWITHSETTVSAYFRAFGLIDALRVTYPSIRLSMV
jgi:hypothetical protein